MKKLKNLTELQWLKIYNNIKNDYNFPESELRKLYEAFRNSEYQSFGYFIKVKWDEILNKQIMDFNEYFNF